MQDASVLATAHYPETLDRIFVSLSTFRVFIVDHPRSLELPLSSLLFGVGSSAGLIL